MKRCKAGRSMVARQTACALAQVRMALLLRTLDRAGHIAFQNGGTGDIMTYLVANLTFVINIGQSDPAALFKRGPHLSFVIA